MKIIKNDGIYKASHISGPKHNYLGLDITLACPNEVQVVQRPFPGEEFSQIDEARLLTTVSERIMRMNQELGVSLFVQRIEYVPSDTPDYMIYGDMAESILRAAAADFAIGCPSSPSFE